MATGGPLLVVGNPPWVTNAELGSLASARMPPKSNVKGLSGLEARTGASNFDVAEAVWLKLAHDLASEAPTIALLCKTSVARSILRFANRAGLPIIEATIRRIDAGRWFHAAVDACLFRVTLAKADETGGIGGGASGVSAGRAGLTPATPGSWPQSQAGWGRARRARPPGDAQWCEDVPVYSALESDEPTAVLGFVRGWLIADRAAHRRCAFADGICPATWRQGLKHDAADVMELAVDADTGQLQDRSGEPVDVESEFVYPLLKGADLKRPPAGRPRRAVIVTQRRIGEDTTRLANAPPQLWAYLRANADRVRKAQVVDLPGPAPVRHLRHRALQLRPVQGGGLRACTRRRSSRLSGPSTGRPVMLDDTCYFLACRPAAEAAALAAL